MATNRQHDYYEVLGVPRDADDRAIKDAFRRLAFAYHPDRNRAPDAEERFKEIAEAYAVLSDPAKRRDYDAGGLSGVEGFSAEDLFGGIDLSDLFGPFGFDSRLIDRLFRAGGGPGRARGADVEVPLAVPLTTIAAGGHEEVTFERPGRCSACGGTGSRAGRARRACADCGGTGRRRITTRRGGLAIQQVVSCPTCQGRGSVVDDPCPRCRGTGEAPEEARVRVTIPQGIEEGTALRIAGHGMPAPAPGGVPGDAYVVVSSRPDPRFVRRGPDLWHEEEIAVADAVLGAHVEVPTLDRPVSVSVAPGTQPGTTLRLAGRGLPHPRGRRRGDLYVTLSVRVPSTLTDRERSLWIELRARTEVHGARAPSGARSSHAEPGAPAGQGGDEPPDGPTGRKRRAPLGWLSPRRWRHARWWRTGRPGGGGPGD